MTIKSSGSSLSFTEISNEFGIPPNKNLGAYRVNATIGSLEELALDSNIPQSGAISFSDFYGKKLNIVVKCTGGNRATAPYGDNVVVVGGFKNKPSRNDAGWQGGKKIFINVTGTYGSDGANDSEFALKTGNSSVWPSGTDMVIDVSSNGRIVGRGGNGGDASGGDGGNGSNGLRYLSGAVINNGGYISGGGGGGGGGADAEQNDLGDRNDAEGGGGGGGNGIPAGSGGNGNGGGESGEENDGGSGRNGGDDSEAEGGKGGGGGSNGANGEDASSGRNKRRSNGSGGEGGEATEAY